MARGAGRQGSTTPPQQKMARAKKKASDVPFPFLELPAEIRNRIYQYTLIDPEHVISLEAKGDTVHRRLMTKIDYLDQWKWGNVNLLPFGEFPALDLSLPWKWRLNNRLSYHLLQACKQVHAEAAPLLYAQNRFLFIDPGTMNRFLRMCGKQIIHIHYITLLHFGYSNIRGRSAFQKLIDAVSLKALTLTFNNRDWGLSKGAATLFAEGFYKFAAPWLWFLAGKTGSKANSLDLLFYYGSSRECPSQRHMQDVQVFKRFKERFGTPQDPARSEIFESHIRAAIQHLMD